MNLVSFSSGPHNPYILVIRRLCALPLISQPWSLSLSWGTLCCGHIGPLEGPQMPNSFIIQSLSTSCHLLRTILFCFFSEITPIHPSRFSSKASWLGKPTCPIEFIGFLFHVCVTFYTFPSNPNHKCSQVISVYLILYPPIDNKFG